MMMMNNKHPLANNHRNSRLHYIIIGKTSNRPSSTGELLLGQRWLRGIMMAMVMAMMMIRMTLVMMIMKMTWNRSSLSTGELMLGRALLESNWSIRISGKTGRSSWWWNRGKTETGRHQNSHLMIWGKCLSNMLFMMLMIKGGPGPVNKSRCLK